jgi:hypothetical protein
MEICRDGCELGARREFWALAGGVRVMETLLSPLQLDAISGVGKTLIVPEPERIVRFLIRSKGPPTRGEITIECCPMKAPGIGEGTMQMTVWRPDGGAISVPTDIGVAAVHYAGKVSGMFRARISTPVTGGTVTILAVRPEEQRGWSRRPS